MTGEFSEEMLLARFLDWRGIETPCEECRGSGRKVYCNTATWLGGIGGQQPTAAVCDVCWGSGDADHCGYDLRKIFNANIIKQGEKLAAEDRINLLADALVLLRDKDWCLRSDEEEDQIQNAEKLARKTISERDKEKCDSTPEA